MKILFLDVDGVLNIMGASYYSHGFNNIGNDPIERHLMVRLEFILERVPDLNIVISSSWFEKQLKRKLDKLRFKYLNCIIGSTPRKKKFRGEQIREYLSDYGHNIETYVVIDDEIDDICGDKCNVIPKENVVEVDMNEGLTNANTLDIITKLNGLEGYDGQEHLASIGNISIFVKKGYRPHVVTGYVTEEDNPFKSFKISNKNLALYMVRKDEDNAK